MLDTTSVYPIFNYQTVQSMVFAPAEKKLYMYARGITTTIIMDPVPISDDVDGDGLPDNWEIYYFGDISREATADSDGDGYSNLQEYLKGAHPNDPNSSPSKAMPWLPLLLDD